MIGAGGVGKSAMTVRFFNGKWLEKYDPTIEDTYRKQVTVFPPQDPEKKKVQPVSILLEIFDTAGKTTPCFFFDIYQGKKNIEASQTIISKEDKGSLSSIQS